jgi:hypothetical protein
MVVQHSQQVAAVVLVQLVLMVLVVNQVLVELELTH